MEILLIVVMVAYLVCLIYWEIESRKRQIKIKRLLAYADHMNFLNHQLLLAALSNDRVAIDQLIEDSNIFRKEWKENERVFIER